MRIPSIPRAYPAIVWLLVLLELLLAYSSGAYFARSWLPVLLLTAALLAIVLILGPPPALSRPSALLLALLGSQLLWTAVSVSWAVSPGNAWEETNRTGLFAMGALLAALAAAWLGRGGAGQLALALAVSIAGVAAGIVYRLATAGEPALLFASGRLHYPVSYWNGLAALLMTGAWLALGLASSRRLPRWALPVLVAAAALLAQLALMPQSRGWLWTLVFVSPWFLVLSPHRFRAALHLGLVLAAVGLGWDSLSAVYRAAGAGGEIGPAVGEAVGVLAISVAAVLLAAAAAQLVERRWSPLPAAWRRGFGAVLLALALGAAGAGLIAVDSRAEGGLGGLVQRARDQISTDAGPAGTAANRFTDVGLSGRLQQWRIAWDAFEARPLLGLGAQNYEFYFYEHRTTGLVVRQPHSQPMQLLAELGLPGAVLWLLFVAAVLGRALLLRFRPAPAPPTSADPAGSGDRSAFTQDPAAVTALVVASLSWFVHSSADWLWQLAGVTWPAMIALGGLAGLKFAGTSTRASTALAVRIAGATLAVLLFASALPAFLSLRYEDVSYANLAEPRAGLAAAATSARLNPFSPTPLEARAEVYRVAAMRAAAGDEAGRGWAVLDNLGLASVSLEEARRREPAGWNLAQRAGMALIEYGEVASLSEAGQDAPADPADPPDPQSPWAALQQTDAWRPPGDPGGVTGSLAATEEASRELDAFLALRAQSSSELVERARRHLLDAARLNPRDTEIRAALEALGSASSP